MYNNRRTYTGMEWFNSEIKNQYLDYAKEKYSVANANNITAIFNGAAVYESANQKDIYNFTARDFRVMFDKNRWQTLTTRKRKLTEIKKYICWCVDNGLCTDNALHNLSDFSKMDVSSVTKQEAYYYSTDDILERIKAFYEVGEYDIRYYCKFTVMLFLYFNQCSIMDIANISKKDVDINLERVKVHHYKAAVPALSDVVIQIPDNFKPYFDALFSTNYISPDGKTRKVIESDYLIPPSRIVAGNEQVSETLARNFTREMNLNTRGIPDIKVIRKGEVEESGKFRAMFDYFKEYDYLKVPIEQIKNVVVESRFSYYNFRQEYGMWVDAMPDKYRIY